MMAVDKLELPEDLVTEILLRLPVKSIIRFNSVAKNWSHLFQTSSFISQHHCLSKEMNRKNMIHNFIFPSDSNNILKSKFKMVRFGDDGKTLVSNQDLHQQPPHHVVGKPDYSMAVGDGLICFGGEDGMMTLWNPATNKFRILPHLNQYIPMITKWADNIVHYCGMDALSNDYKVLVIPKYGDRPSKYQYAIYRMSSDSWRVFKEEELELINDQLHRIRPNRASVCVNGVFYWQSWEPKLLAFHLDTEVFEILPSPTEWGELMALHDGRLALWEWEWPDSNTTPVGVVWVMNDDDQGNNWTKLFNINPPDPEVFFNRMYCFWTHGKVFVQVSGGDSISHHQLFLHDIEKGEFSDLGFEIEGNPWVFIYQESLLAVAPSPY